MQPKVAMVGIIIRKDGTVPFDDDVHPDVRAHILSHLSSQGHTIAPMHGTKHVRIVDYKV